MEYERTLVEQTNDMISKKTRGRILSNRVKNPLIIHYLHLDYFFSLSPPSADEEKRIIACTTSSVISPTVKLTTAIVELAASLSIPA